MPGPTWSLSKLHVTLRDTVCICLPSSGFQGLTGTGTRLQAAPLCWVSMRLVQHGLALAPGAGCLPGRSSSKRSVLSHSVCGIQVGCKLSLVFFQYCIMANFYWLLVEGLYLHTLLVAIFSPSRRFVAYLLIGWGKDSPDSPLPPPNPPGS